MWEYALTQAQEVRRLSRMGRHDDALRQSLATVEWFYTPPQLGSGGPKRAWLFWRHVSPETAKGRTTNGARHTLENMIHKHFHAQETPRGEANT